jgi:hypothetical protein
VKTLAAALLLALFCVSGVRADDDDSSGKKPWTPPHLNATKPVVGLDTMGKGAAAADGASGPASNADRRSVKAVRKPRANVPGAGSGGPTREVPRPLPVAAPKSAPKTAQREGQESRCPEGTQPLPDGSGCWEPARCPQGTVLQGDHCARPQ